MGLHPEKRKQLWYALVGRIVVRLKRRPTKKPPERANDPFSNKAWFALAEDCVAIFDELDRLALRFDPERSALCSHICKRLLGAVERSGVEVIGEAAAYDSRIQLESNERPRESQLHFVKIVSPGFRIGRKVLRRARAEFASPENEGQP